MKIKMNAKRTGLLCVALMCGLANLVFFSTAGDAETVNGETADGVDPAANLFQPRRVVRAFPAIVMPDVISADRVTDQVRDEELVLGVSINNVARAYPINMLTRPTREIINDKLGGRAIAATW